MTRKKILHYNYFLSARSCYMIIISSEVACGIINGEGNQWVWRTAF